MDSVTEVLAACRDWAAEQWRVELEMAAIRGAERQARLADWLGGWAAPVARWIAPVARWIAAVTALLPNPADHDCRSLAELQQAATPWAVRPRLADLRPEGMPWACYYSPERLYATLAAAALAVIIALLIRSGRLVAEARAAANMWRLACMWMSALITVVWDPFSVSTGQIMLWRSCRYWRHGPDAFTVSASHPRGRQFATRARRFAAWMYRWHAAPEPEDWELWSRRLGINVPTHTLLLFRDGQPLGHGVVVRIGAASNRRVMIPSDGKLTSRSVKFITIQRSELARKFGVYDAGTCEGGTYDTSFSYVDSEAPERLGPIQRGGLAPERLIADSKPPHGDVYGVCKSPRKVA
jgi:hypothetical protein